LENIMKIGQPADKPALTPAGTARTGAGDAPKAQPAQAAVEGEASTKVVLSDAAAALLSATPSAKADFDADKVDRISKAIADGSFKVNHEAVADKLIANAKELLNKYSH
jgi:negative regulator of flagellin synthesis FlgM